MFKVASTSTNVKRSGFHSNADERFDSSRGASSLKSDCAAEYLASLHETIDRLCRENADGRAHINELTAEIASLRPYLPSYISEEILLQFCCADTTELPQAEIFAARPESTFEVQAALSELCAHKLLAIDNSANKKRYVITVRGQELCYTCRR